MLLFSRHKREGIRGAILVQVLAFSAIGIIILAGMVNWTNTTLRMAVKAENKSRALQVAEAGIEYYRWHLAHDPTDFQDGTATSGPYAHNFYDAGGNAIGRFILTITPPPVGSFISANSKASIRSTQVPHFPQCMNCPL
jgi:type II secretory pathway pseudopilin PulG